VKEEHLKGNLFTWMPEGKDNHANIRAYSVTFSNSGMTEHWGIGIKSVILYHIQTL
jgi:hypothetical protein